MHIYTHIYIYIHIYIYVSTIQHTFHHVLSYLIIALHFEVTILFSHRQRAGLEITR